MKSRDQLLQPPILILELLEPLRVADAHPAVLRLPPVQRLRPDPQAPAELLRRRPPLVLLDRRDNLFLREPPFRIWPSLP